MHNVVDTQVRFSSLVSRLYSCLGKNLDLVFFFCLLLQIAFSLIEEQEGRRRPLDDYISFVSLLADPRYCGTFYYYHVSFIYDLSYYSCYEYGYTGFKRANVETAFLEVLVLVHFLRLEIMITTLCISQLGGGE